jgi:hypothetical protein
VRVQAAQILLIMRPQNELPSDFQDYTLVALIAVAAHLSGHKIGSEEGITSLANMYKQAPVDLRSVFNHILGQMREYRNHTEMMKSLDVAVAFSEPSLPAHPANGAGARPLRHVAAGCLAQIAAHCDCNASARAHPRCASLLLHTAASAGELADSARVLAAPAAPADSFEVEMEKIAKVASVVAAVNAGPMSEEAFGEYNHRMAWVNAVAGSVAAATPETKALVEAVRSWTEMKKQVVHAEMAHRWRVDAVTQRYQQHMEKVCANCDHAARLLQSSKQVVRPTTARVAGVLCSCLQISPLQACLQVNKRVMLLSH